MMLKADAKPFVPSGNFFMPGAQPVVVPPAQIPAPVQPMPAQPVLVPVPGTVIAYANRFDEKHVTPDIDASSAVVKGRARGNVKFSTVFKQDYLEGVILADAAPRLAGHYQLSIACHAIPAGKFALAENVDGKWKALKAPMFYAKVFYTITIGAGGGKIVTLTHLETDF